MAALVDSEPAGSTGFVDGVSIVGQALRMGVPVAAVLGQAAGWNDHHGDPILQLALRKAGKSGDDWKSLLTREPLPQGFYEWLGERFLHRSPSIELVFI